MGEGLRPEKIYSGFFKANIFLEIFAGFLFSIAMIYFVKSKGFEISWIFVIALPLLILGGVYMKYKMNTNIQGFPGATIVSKNQRHIKQIAYIILPTIILLTAIFYSYFMSRYGLVGYITVIVAVIFSELLFIGRLKKLEREEGKDTQPMMSLGEAVLFFLMVLVITGLVIFSTLAS